MKEPVNFFFILKLLLVCSILFLGSLLSWSFFVLRHWRVSQGLTPRMSPKRGRRFPFHSRQFVR